MNDESNDMPQCAHCRDRRKNMGKYTHPFTGKQEYLHKICYIGLFNRKQLQDQLNAEWSSLDQVK